MTLIRWQLRSAIGHALISTGRRLSRAGARALGRPSGGPVFSLDAPRPPSREELAEQRAAWRRASESRRAATQAGTS